MLATSGSVARPLVDDPDRVRPQRGWFLVPAQQPTVTGVPLERVLCSGCGTRPTPEWRWCPECGGKLVPDSAVIVLDPRREDAYQSPGR